MCYVENKDGWGDQEYRAWGKGGYFKQGGQGRSQRYTRGDEGEAIRIIQAREDGPWLGPRLWPWK